MNKIGYIRVICLSENRVIKGAYITLKNSCGKEVQKKMTDCNGCVVIPICSFDRYFIRAETDCRFSPVAQTKTAWLSPNSRHSLTFVFSRLVPARETGKLVVTLADAEYPEYTLKGDITLWRGLKLEQERPDLTEK